MAEPDEFIDRQLRLAAHWAEPDAESPGADTILRRAARRRARRVGWLASAVAATTALAVIAGLLHFGTTRQTDVTTVGTPAPTVGSATAAQLAAGHWSTLPGGPVAHPAASVWTGRELLVWGGAGPNNQQTDYGIGAAYDPQAETWRRLASAPIAARSQAAMVWAGTAVIVWGGYDSGQRLLDDGAEFNPGTNRWRMLPRGPLPAMAGSVAVWTGRDAIFLGDTQGNSMVPYGAAYDPGRNSWRSLALPKAPAGHGLDWESAVALNGKILAWSWWSMKQQQGQGSFTESGGVDLFSYDDAGRWRLIPATSDAMVDARQVLWTGQRVVVAGMPYNCGGCPGPLAQNAVALYDPSTNAWRRLPAAIPENPFALLSEFLWTGNGLFSLAPQPTPPIVAAAFDPTSGMWIRSPGPPATADCADAVWTGRQVLMACASRLQVLTPGP